MRQHLSRHLSMRVLLTLLVMVEILLAVLASWGIAELLQYFHITFKLSMTGWLILLSCIIGGAVTNILSYWFFTPITRLCRSMSQVSKGDFHITLTTNSKFLEIQELYSNFNLMTKELRATEILQTDFVSNVSHEFKTPINAIEGYATLLQNRESATPEEQSRYVDKILLNTRRLSNLVGNILLLSKVDNQAILTKQTTFRLDEQIRQSIVILEPEWAKKDIEFDVELEEVEYTGSEALLPHVWNNLIGNAIKFDPPGGTIRLRLARSKNSVSFIIEDSGPGISEEAMPHIFDRFYQSDSSHKEEGNGLGLALVKQILNVCHGSITA